MVVYETGNRNAKVALELEGFVDASAMLRCGVYALVYRGVVVYVGKSKCMLGRVYGHRSNYTSKRRKEVPSWVPTKGFLFDEIHVRPCAPDLVDALEYALINTYKPKHNTQLKHTLPVTLPAHLIAQITGQAPVSRLSVDRRF